MEALIFLFFAAIIGGVYFLPTIIAFTKKKANTTSILLLNFFLGWSLIGWVVSLVWATSKDAQPQQVIIHNNSNETISKDV